MITQDLLAARPAVGKTTVPGHWTIRLPPSPSLPPVPTHPSPSNPDAETIAPSASSSSITIRRYRCIDPAVDSGSVHGRSRDDPVEKGWRAVNTRRGTVELEDEDGQFGVEGDLASIRNVEGVLQGGCAIVDHERALWVFSVNEQIDMVSDLEEIRPTMTIDPPRLVKCPEHEHALTCLMSQPSGSSPCAVTWAGGDGELTRYWGLFRDAIVEKLAWRMGKRVIMRPGPLALSDRPEIHAELFPLSNTRLLLKVRPNPPLRCKLPTHEDTHALPRPLSLSPLGLPALSLGPYHPSPGDDEIWTATFESTLGHAFNNGHTSRQLDVQLGHVRPTWTVTWVPVITNQQDVSTRTSGQLVAEWQKCQGVITIWPSHLIHNLDNQSSNGQHPSRRTSKQSIGPALTVPTTDELMSTASGVFEFMSTYREPMDSPDGTPDTEPLDGKDFDHMEQSAAPSPVTRDGREGDDGQDVLDRVVSNGGGSDIDDLFSSHSTPVPQDPTSLPQLASNPFDSPLLTGIIGQDTQEGGEMMKPMEPMELDVDVIMSSPQMATRMSTMEMEEQGEVNQVTEDDFNFFDSPVDTTAAVDDEAGEQGIGIGGDGDERKNLNQFPEDVVATAADHQSNGGTEMGVSVEDGHPVYAVSGANVAVSPDKYPDGQSRDTPSKAAIVINSTSARVAKRAKDLARDLVPSSFRPLNIPPPSTLPSFAYSLPSPAPTPESLRLDLVERLKSPSTTTKYDYASLWDIESEQSDMDEDEGAYSGAPPTPISVQETDNLPSGMVSPAHLDGLDDTGEITWEGLACIGAEWVVLRNEPKIVESLTRTWNYGWGSGNIINAPMVSWPLSPPREDGDGLKWDQIEWDQVLSQFISNRHLRDMYTGQDTWTGGQSQDGLLRHGLTLVDLVNEGDSQSATTNPRSLPPCSIHAGFSNNVMQLSIAGLRYWRQLGLQPVGGRKNLEAFVICEVDEGSVRAARTFLTQMAEVYEGCQLGTHRPGDAPAARDGVITIPTAGFADSLAALLTAQHTNSVIYVLLPPSNSTTLLPLLEKLFSPSMTPTETCFAHVLPIAAIQPCQVQNLAFEVYDRILKPIRPISLRGFPLDASPPSHLQYPSFTLASDAPPKPELTLAWPLRSYDVMNKWRMIHGGYVTDFSTKKTVAFVIDAQGEGWKVKSWPIGEQRAQERVHEVWKFINEFAEVAAVEWRLAICSLGLMDADELSAWITLYTSTRAPVTLIMVEPSSSSSSFVTRPRLPIPMIPPATFADPSTRIIDESLSGHTASLTIRTPLTLSIPSSPIPSADSSTKIVFPQSSFILSFATPSGDYTTSTYHIITHQSPALREETPDTLFSSEFYRLSCLGRMRFGLQGGLPVHLECVRVGQEGIATILAS